MNRIQRITFSVIFCLIYCASDSRASESSSTYVLKHTVATSASPKTIWMLWQDVENWKRFDTLLQYSYLDSPRLFSNNATGAIKARGALKTKFRLLDVMEGQSFTERLYVPLFQTIDLKRRVTKNQAGITEFTHEVHFKGSLRFLVRMVAAKSFRKELPLVMGRLKTLAEEIESPNRLERSFSADN